MTIEDLLACLLERDIELEADGTTLRVRGDREALANPAVIENLRVHKQQLLELLARAPLQSETRSGATSDPRPDGVQHRVALVSLSEAERLLINLFVEGGPENIQDICPLLPLQQGILFHSLRARTGDPYLTCLLHEFKSCSEIFTYCEALDGVIARHDILRSAAFWEGLSQPVQVVHRRASLTIEEVRGLDPAADVAEQLIERFHPRRHRIDLRRPPLLRVYYAHDPVRGRWIMLELRHHLAGDHVSMDVMQREITAYLAGRRDELPHATPLRMFLARLRDGKKEAEHEAFFRKLLSGYDEPCAPFGLSTLLDEDERLAQARVRIDDTVVRSLRQHARELHLSFATICHLTCALVLWRTSGRGDVVFGTVLTGRFHAGPGSDSALGMFINTLPMRLRLTEATVLEALRETQALLNQLVEHEQAPLSLAQRCSSIKAPEPLFTCLLNYRHSVDPDACAEAEKRHAPSKLIRVEERSVYPLVLSVDDVGHGLVVTVQAAPPAHAPLVCELFGEALSCICAELKELGRRGLRELDIMPRSQRLHELKRWNDTRVALQEPAYLHACIERQTRVTPGATAIVDGDRCVTYLELSELVGNVSRHLQRIGVVGGERVVICVERGLGMIVAILATLTTGAVYVPLDPEHPDERLRLILDDCAPRVVIGQRTVRSLLTPLAGDLTVIELEEPEAWPMLPPNISAPPRTTAGARNIAYIMYTSGSAGKPKGVMVEHRGVVNLLLSMKKLLRIHPSDRVLALTTFVFDISVLEMFLPLIRGARVVLLPHGQHRDPTRIVKQIAAQGITVMQATPTLWRMLLDAAWTGSPGMKALCGGEALSRDLAWRLVARVNELWNVYGPTETTIWSAAQRVTHAQLQAGEPALGYPLGNTRIYLLDSELRPVPLGAIGEICISGVGVAQGYYGRSDLTRQRFVLDLFSEEPLARMYRTGDLGRRRSDGSLEFLGRTDSQVKIRGFRIELGDIEVHLCEHPAVRHAVVVAHGGSGERLRLIAYYTSVAKQPDDHELRAHLLRYLPDHMLPAAYVRLDQLPLTATGKVDRARLPAPSLRAPATEAPIDDLERTIESIWCEVLGRTSVGRHDEFFEIGGDSISLLQMLAHMNREWPALKLTDLFHHASVARMAAYISHFVGSSLPDGVVGVRTSGAELPLLLVHEYYGLDFYFGALARHVWDEIPIYGLGAVPLSEPQILEMPELARRQMLKIRQIQPVGPYRIAGWSFGGNLAYEIATQLVEAGHSVEFLGLIDSASPAVVRARTAAGDDGFASAAAPLPASEVGAAFAPTLAVVDASESNQRDRLAAHRHALEQHQPKPLSAIVHLFVAEELTGAVSLAPSSKFLGWDEFVAPSRIRRVLVPGNHFTALATPNVVELGAAISRALGHYPHRATLSCSESLAPGRETA